MIADVKNKVAIIGVGGKFPGADSCDELWRLVIEKKESISRFTDEELSLSGVESSLYSKDNYIPAKGILEDVARFDSEFFGISPAEAKILDPQHRIFLEESWAVIESAGYNPHDLPGRVSIFASSSSPTYLINQLLANKQELKNYDQYQLLLANDKDYLATRVAFKLNLTGPALAIQSGCSSSLVAVHMASQSILNGECDMALAGGVSLSFPYKSGYLYKKNMVGSSDGHCYAFDHRADGTVRGDGIGIVFLKLLEDAIKDRDNIIAVICGSAVNNDGEDKVGFTAPSVNQQAAVIREAVAVADVPMDTVEYIETHGTGTDLGDPIEAAALKEAFGAVKHQCALSTLKPNIGHLDAASGVAGIIKASLSLYHKKIPPAINFEKLNNKIDFSNTPFYINTELKDWDTRLTCRRAGVSSFGIGGTNAHVILESAPQNENIKAEAKFAEGVIIIISAKSFEGLKKYAVKLIDYFKTDENINLANVAYTLQVGRKAFKFRCAFVCDSIRDAISQLVDFVEKPEDVRGCNKLYLVVGGDNSLKTTSFLLEKGISEKDFEKGEGLSPHIVDGDDLTKRAVLNLISKLWICGHKINWSKFNNDESCYRVKLPTYPFGGREYLIKSGHDIEADNVCVDISSDADSMSMDIYELINRLWSSILGIEHIGNNDNFFELGGDSLLAVQFIDKLPGKYKNKLNPITLFEFPTIGSLANFLINQPEDPGGNGESLGNERDALEGDLFL